MSACSLDPRTPARPRRRNRSERRRPRPPRLRLEILEDRTVPNAAFDLIGLTQMRADPRFAGIDGSGFSVAILDTGLDIHHPLIAPNFKLGKDFISGADTPTVTGDHGTHVAGSVGAADPEIGVAPAVGLVAANVFHQTPNGLLAPNTATEAALQWVLDNHEAFNIVAVNMSLGGGNYTDPNLAASAIYADEIRRLEQAGVVVVSAGGNNYKDSGTRLGATQTEVANLSSPGILSTIGVGAVWQDGTRSGVTWGSGSQDFTTGPDRITSFSNRLNFGLGDGDPRNDFLTLFAPGAIITSTVPGGKLAGMGGTSMASPIVAGSVALVQEAAVQFLGRRLGALEVRDLLLNTADVIHDGDDEDDNVVNTGEDYLRLNVFRAVEQLFNTGKAPPPPPENIDPNGVISGAVDAGTLSIDTPFNFFQGTIGADFGQPVGSANFDDVDLFRFRVEGAGFVPVRIDVASDFDPLLRLFDANGTELAFNDDSFGLDPSLSVPLPAGDYFVGVSGYPNFAYDPNIAGSGTRSSKGNYDLFLFADFSDPNGTRLSAVPIGLTADGIVEVGENIGFDRVGGSLTRVDASDVDMFVFVVPEDGKLTIAVEAAGSGVSNGLGDPFLRVFGVAVPADELARDDDSGPGLDSLIQDLPVRRGDVLFIGVSAFGNGNYDPDSLDDRDTAFSEGEYRLRLDFASVDVNGTIPTALRSGPGQVLPFPLQDQRGFVGFDSVGGKQSSAGVYDVDFIRFDPASDGVLTIRVDSFRAGVSDPVDAILTLFDGNGNLLMQIDDTFDSRGNFVSLDPTIRFTVQAGQTYYAAVSGFPNFNFNPFIAASGFPSFDTGEYFLSASLEDIDSSRGGNNNGRGRGGVVDIVLGEIFTDVIGQDQGFADGRLRDLDVYRFVADRNGVIDARIESLEALVGGRGFLRVFDAAGNEIPSTFVTIGPVFGGAIRFNAVQGQEYFIGVSGLSAPDSKDYDINNPDVILSEEQFSDYLLSAGSFQLVLNALASLDIDGNGVSGGSNDAILAARYLLDFPGSALTQDIEFAPGATRTTAEAIRQFLDASRALMLDSDGNGAAQGSNDAILVARYLLSFPDSALLQDINFGINGFRNTVQAVRDYFDPLRVGGPGGRSPRGVPPTAAGPVQTAPGGAGESLPAPAPSGGRSGPAAPGSGNVAPLSVRVVAPPVAGLPSNYDPLGVLTRAVPVGPSAEPATPPEDDDVGDTINAVYVGPEPAGVVLPEGDAGGGAGTVTDPLGGFDLDPLAGLIPG